MADKPAGSRASTADSGMTDGSAPTAATTIEQRLSVLEEEHEALKEAVASLGAPQITQGKHDSLQRFRNWFEQRFET